MNFIVLLWNLNLVSIIPNHRLNLSNFLICRVVMTVYFTFTSKRYHLKVKLLKKIHNFYFPAKCNNWGRSIKIHDKIVKLVHNAQKNRYIRTHFSFFLATPYLLSYPLQSFGGKFEIVNFYKQLDFYMVPLKLVCKIHRHYYSSLNFEEKTWRPLNYMEFLNIQLWHC